MGRAMPDAESSFYPNGGHIVSGGCYVLHRRSVRIL